MAKNKNRSGKRIVVREAPPVDAQAKALVEKARLEPERPSIRERPREKDSGFGVLKVVAGGIIALIVGSGVLIRMFGGETDARGDKLLGELCASTIECRQGTVCYSYKGDKHRCYKTCSSDEKCDPGYTCESSIYKTGRRSSRIRAVCVENAKL